MGHNRSNRLFDYFISTREQGRRQDLAERICLEPMKFLGEHADCRLFRCNERCLAPPSRLATVVLSKFEQCTRLSRHPALPRQGGGTAAPCAPSGGRQCIAGAVSLRQGCPPGSKSPARTRSHAWNARPPGTGYGRQMPPPLRTRRRLE